MHLKKKSITIGIIAGAAILFMTLAVWIGMMLGARSRENQTENKVPSSAPDTVESTAESAASGDSIPADSEIVPAKAEPESVAEPSPEPTDVPESLAVHVTGIRDFAIIEGMVPDVMAGISWDDTVLDVTAAHAISGSRVHTI